jgi:hypothetical protein
MRVVFRRAGEGDRKGENWKNRGGSRLKPGKERKTKVKVRKKNMKQ